MRSVLLAWLVLASVFACLPRNVEADTAVDAGPNPGDVFREYTYTNTYGDAGGAIRVGGKQGVSYPDRGSDFSYVNAWIDFPHQVDLEYATRAEIVVEKILSHNGTQGFAIQWSDSDWIELPAPENLPESPQDYYHHTCITVPLPLKHIRTDLGENRFRLKVDPDNGWGWPQHLVYGVHLRVYYSPEQKPHVAGRMQPVPANSLGDSVRLAVSLSNRIRRVDRVDYIGKYEGINWEGDGNYRRWHYFYYHGQLIHNLASSWVAPYSATWDTTWVPDQPESMEIAARITDDTGLTTMTPALNDLQLARSSSSVELCKPRQVPPNWVSRKGPFEEFVEVRGDLSKAVAARLVWSSWSPGYMNGVLVNGALVLQSEGPKYRYFDHRVALPDLSVLRSGTNTISTGKTPLYDGKMVHGMEVNWPGIQLLIQYQD